MTTTGNLSATHPKFTIVALGEILWDIFPDRTCFGGAPLNYTCAAAELGSDIAAVHLVSGVGNDELGRDAIEELKSHCVVLHSVQKKQDATGTVTIDLSENGSASYNLQKMRTRFALVHLANAPRYLRKSFNGSFRRRRNRAFESLILIFAHRIFQIKLFLNRLQLPMS